MADVLAVDCTTGEATTRPLTAAEQTKVADAQAETAQRRQANDTQQATATTIRQQAQQALAGNRTFVQAAKPGTAAAQASAAYDQAVALSRQQNGLIRLLLGQLDATT